MPSPAHQRKRKAPDEEERGSGEVVKHVLLNNDDEKQKPTKASKKQLRDEARARARAWAELDKTKTKATATKASAITAVNPIEERLKSPTKRRKLAPADAATLTKPKPKAELLEARLRAKKWAEETKLSPIKSEVPTIASTTKAHQFLPGSKKIPTTVPTSQHRNSKPPVTAAATAVEIFNDEEMQDAAEEAIFQEVIEAQKKIKPAETFAESLNPIAASVYAATVNIAKEQSEMERKVQQQVLANAYRISNVPQQQLVFPQKMPPPSRRPAAIFHEPLLPRPQPHFEQPLPPFTPLEGRKKRPFLSICLSVLVGITAVALGVIFTISSNNIGADVGTLTGATKIPPCFRSNHDMEPPTQDLVTCDASMEQLECPANALCSDGALRSCLDSFHIVAASGDACVLTDEANITLQQVQTTLLNWTIQDMCGLQGCELAQMAESKGPVFLLTNFEEGVHEALLAQSDNLLLTKDKDGNTLVGLSDYYMENELLLPWMCWLYLLVIQVLGAASRIFVGMVGFSGAIMWSFSMAYPWVSLVCLIVLLALRRYRQRKAEYQVLLADVANVRHLAYQKLMADSLEHVVLHLRDEVALDLYPTSKSERSHLILKVWPRVVADVRLDNRVHKTNQLLQGKPRDVWQWVATPNKR